MMMMLDFKHVHSEMIVGHSDRAVWQTVAYTWYIKVKKS